MLILAGLHVVSRDFSDESPCSGIVVIHKISVTRCQSFALSVCKSFDLTLTHICLDAQLTFFTSKKLNVIFHLLVQRHSMKIVHIVIKA